MKTFSLFMAIACFHFSAAQPQKLPDYFKTEVPRGWVCDALITGDLNKDQQPDAVLVIRNTSAGNFKLHDGLGQDTLDLNPRRLLIYFREGRGYRKILSTDQFLPSVNSAVNPCLADPFAEGSIGIERGLLKMGFHYWLSCGSYEVTDWDYTFRFQQGRFELIGLDVSSLHRASGEMSATSYNFMTGKKQEISGGNEFFPEKDHPGERWSVIKKRPLLNLAVMTDHTVKNRDW
ncbi:hypothetical protein [Niabella drilacis]|uniref:Uncharacterized protein n=1 Tax=Niabella drilacis (strain DSM 25811 / CCM 8410 / CCUG 62505 / LMG 26954 / E90) TaxID=1285928 RepID=A0A1G6J1S1_NIADE|nr:hypothetical protein [Niabella drilacis]SDC11936.1 hypothetical protein SAMN04487894_101375 [Niabella drilacis]